MFVLSTITDDSYGMPAELKRSWKIRFLFGPSFLTSVVLVNGYLGLAISSFTTPFKLNSIGFFQNLTHNHYTQVDIDRDQLWSKAYELLGLESPWDYNRKKAIGDNQIPRMFDNESEFYVFSSMSSLSMEMDVLETLGPNPSELNLPAITNWVFWQSFFVIFFSSSASYFLFLQNNQPYNTKAIREDIIALNLFLPMHTIIPDAIQNTVSTNHLFTMSNKLALISSIENEIIKWERSVFADSTDEVNREFKYLSRLYPHIQFFKSKETLFRRERFWLFKLCAW